MKFYWTKGSSVLSKTIRWSLNEPVSHFAFAFDDLLIIHSNLLGIELCGEHRFLKSHEIVFQMTPNYTREQEDDLYYKIVKNFDDRDYDYKAFSYFVFRGLIHKALKIPIPKTSPYNDGRNFICTEIAGLLPDWDIITQYNPIELSITSPYKLYKYMLPIFGEGR